MKVAWSGLKTASLLYKPTYKMLLQHGIFGLIFNFGFVVNTIKTVSQV
jgi:hypothetical protein